MRRLATLVLTRVHKIITVARSGLFPGNFFHFWEISEKFLRFFSFLNSFSKVSHLFLNFFSILETFPKISLVLLDLFSFLKNFYRISLRNKTSCARDQYFSKISKEFLRGIRRHNA